MKKQWMIAGGICLAAGVICFGLGFSHIVQDNDSAGSVDSAIRQTSEPDQSAVTPAGDASSQEDACWIRFDYNYVPLDTPLTAAAEGLEGEISYEWYLNGEKTDVTGDSFTATQEDLECFLTVKAADGEHTVSGTMYISRLPVLYINTSDGTVGDLDYTNASVFMQGAEMYPLTDETGYTGDIQIRLRGNSTRYRDKHPYKIKLEKKTDLFGMGKSKHWVLLANDIDHTLIRNKLVMDFARDLGMETASKSVNVVLIMDQEYQGVYQLCEQVRIGGSQVDITDWEEIAEDTASAIAAREAEAQGFEKEEEEQFADDLEEFLTGDYSWLCEPYKIKYDGKSYTASDYVSIPPLTGGFLLEADFYNQGETNKDTVATFYQQPFYFNTPENAFTNDELFEYAKKYIQTFEYALHSSDFTYHDAVGHYRAVAGQYSARYGWEYSEKIVEYSDPERDGMHYSELFDMDSLVQNFLVCEFTRNWDSMKNSVFLYKDVDGPAYMGPVWDFDWAFGNINMYNIDTWYPTGWQTTDDYFTREQFYQSQQWNRYLIKDRDFVQKVYDKWQEIRPTLIEDMIKEGGTLDTYRRDLAEAGAMNDEKWSYTYASYHSVGYEESWDNLVTFIRERISWMDEQFQDVDTLYESLNMPYSEWQW